ncbi:DUF4064 domain-containing protein [Staphylococcus kloosii]|uniref:DUF4064 domain-containing protein n=1 Tax=Staphylococcus kloosii TaxID=29384 RepID=A0A151A317_9STAP|nr:DUF4064 domain-containing protein [Staphylococcus kloosii]KYH13707.1 hypothetical protein A0131_02650 [Staphylococcus kloosii]
MIKRTAERVITWIGVALQALSVLIIGGLTLVMLFGGMKEDMISDRGNLSASEAASQANMALTFFISYSIIGIIVLIIAILSGMWIGKKDKLAGILLIIIGVLSILGNFICAILWIIAGIMLLVRKPKPSMFNDKPVEIEKSPFEQDNRGKMKNNSNDELQNEHEKNNLENPYKY